MIAASFDSRTCARAALRQHGPDFFLAFGITLLRDPFGKAMADRLGLCRVSSRSVRSSLKFYVVTKPGAAHAAVERLISRILAVGGSAE